ncbi:hypothetical protein VaNZ11_000934, partial [Volvox africanus]
MPTGRLTSRANFVQGKSKFHMQTTKTSFGVLYRQFQSFVRPAGLIAALSLEAASAHSRAGSMPAIIGYPAIHNKVAAFGARAALPKANYPSRRTTAVAIVNNPFRSSSSSNHNSHNSHNSNADTAGSEGASGGVANPDKKRSSDVWPPPLEEWLRNHGGTVNGVELRSVLFPSGVVDRQLRATSDHPAGAILISVPRMLQIRYDNVEEAAAATAATAATDATSTDTIIPALDAAALVALYDMMPKGSDTGAAAWPFKQALTLLYHLSRGSVSPLLPYIAHLPGIAAGVPTPRVAMLMHDDAVEELQYSNVQQDIRNQKYWLNHVSTEVLGRLPHGTDVPGASVSTVSVVSAAAAAGRCGSSSASAVPDPFRGLAVDAELFGWAVAVTMSRSFGLTRFRTHTCVPLVDMANHVAPYSASNCEIRTGSGGEVLMYAKRPIQAGEDLTLTYGTHDNHNLLLSYGFTLQPNPNDAFYFDIDLSTIESLVEGLMEDGSGRTGLPPWQLQLLKTHLRLKTPSPDGDEYGKGSGSASASGVSSSDNNSSSSSGAIRVYLSATLPPAAAAKLSTWGDVTTPVDKGDESDAAVEMAGAAEERAATTGPYAGAVGFTVRQPVDPQLLAALRIATLQDETWYRILQPMSVDQIGGWANLLARQQEITVMRLLAALVTALYTTFPTTIQQDRQLLKAASVGVAADAAATSISPPPKQAHSLAVSFAIDNYSADNRAAMEG